MMPWDSFLTEQDRAVIIVGGATSNCVRATVFDAAPAPDRKDGTS